MHFNAAGCIPRSPSWSSTFLVSAAFQLPPLHWIDSVECSQTSPSWEQTKFKAKYGEYLRMTAYCHVYRWLIMLGLYSYCSSWNNAMWYRRLGYVFLLCTIHFSALHYIFSVRCICESTKILREIKYECNSVNVYEVHSWHGQRWFVS